MLKANGVSASSKKASGDDDLTTPASTPVKRKPAAGDAGSAKKKTKATKKEESDDDMKDVKPVVRARAPRTPKKELKKEPKEEPVSPASGKFCLQVTVTLVAPDLTVVMLRHGRLWRRLGCRHQL
jgi:hypothetical protein